MSKSRSVEKTKGEDRCPECGQQETCDAFSVADCPYLEEADSDTQSTLRQTLIEYQQNYSKYKLLCDAAPDAIFVADAETGTILEANEKAAELLGIPVDEIIGMHQTQLHPPEEAQRYAEIFRRHIHTKGAVPIEEDVYVCDKDGQKIPVQINASVTQLDDRKVILGIFRDARQIKQLLADLQASRQRYKRLSEVTFEGILIHAAGEVIDVNPQFLEMFGYTEEELRKINIFELVKAPYREHVKEIIASGQECRYEAFGVRKDGSTFLYECQARNIQVEGMRARVAVFRDLTRQKQQEEQLKAVFEASADCILVWDKDYNYLYANQAAIDHVKTTRDKVIGKNMRDGLGHIPDFMRLWMSRVDEVFKTGKPMRVEDAVPVGDKIVYSESVLSPIRNPGGEMFAVSVVYRDITEQKKTELQLKESERKYRHLYDNAQVALFRTALDGTLLDYNKECLAFFGYPLDQKEEKFRNKISVADYYVNKERRQAFIETLMKHKLVKGFQAELKRADGTTIWVSFFAEVFPEDGYIEGMMYDITANKVLSPAEQSVLDIIMQGKSNKEIAKILGRSVRTVEDHRAHIMQKLGATNLVELTQKAMNLPNLSSEE